MQLLHSGQKTNLSKSRKNGEREQTLVGVSARTYSGGVNQPVTKQK